MDKITVNCTTIKVGNYSNKLLHKYTLKISCIF